MALGLLTRDFGHGWNFGAIVIFICLFVFIFIFFNVANFGTVVTKKNTHCKLYKGFFFGEFLEKNCKRFYTKGFFLLKIWCTNLMKICENISFVELESSKTN